MDLRIERIACSTVRRQPQALDRGAQLGRDGRERAALLQVAVLLGARQVVEHGQKTLDGVPDRALALDLAVRLGALAVVGVLRRQPLQVGEPLGGQLIRGGLTAQQVQVVVTEEDVLVLAVRRAHIHELLMGEVGLGAASVSGCGPRALSALRLPNLAGLGVDPALVADDRLLTLGLVRALPVGVLLRHGYLVSSSSTTSASTTSSSDEPLADWSPAGASELAACSDCAEE